MNRSILLVSTVLLGASTALSQQSLRSTAQPDQRRESAPGSVQQEERPIDAPAQPGPAALRELLSEYDRTRDQGLLPRIDAAANQRDAAWSRLYWYTDLSQAKAAAAAEHKPILYLRLLGKLTDEYSCANSRFFRTVLYANSNVSRLLRERFILVWESERPVPVVTIDYGDGRVLKRTLTGNSIHYVLSPDGTVVDALPGLYDPVTFGSILQNAAEVAVTTSPERRSAHLVMTCSRLLSDYQRDSQLVATGAATPSSTTPGVAEKHPSAQRASTTSASKTLVEGPIITQVEPAPAGEPPAIPARDAADRAFSKVRVERPLVQAVNPAEPPVTTTTAAFDASLWPRIAERHLADARLDANSTALFRSQSAAFQTDPALFDRTLVNFERSIAEDTVRNNLEYRPRILVWMIEATGPIALEDLNRRVYAELFLTPRSDPWLGLVPEATYSALTNNGCIPPQQR